MKKVLFHTNNSVAPLAVRMLSSFVMFPHGAQKLFGWFHGFGFEGTMDYFTKQVGLPWFIGFLVIIIEFFGSLFIAVGFATRIWGLGLLVIMSGIIITTFNEFFFMNWFGTQKSEGYEFFLLAIGMSLSLIISGGGRYSVDALLQESPKKRKLHPTALAA